MILQFYAKRYLEEIRRKKTRSNLYSYIHSKNTEDNTNKKKLNKLLVSNELVNTKRSLDIEIDEVTMNEDFKNLSDKFNYCPKIATYVIKYIIDSSYPNTYLKNKDFQNIFMEMYKDKCCSEYIGHFMYYTEFPDKLNNFRRRLLENYKPKVEENNLLVKALTHNYNYERKLDRTKNFISNKHTQEVQKYDYTDINEAEFFQKIKAELKNKDTKNSSNIILC